MQLVFVRHGQAEDIHNGISDAERRLTEKGREKMKRGAAGIKVYLGQTVTALWASPLIRAVQTAQILASTLQLAEIEKITAIGSGDWDALIQKLRTVPDDACIVMVGHEPYLGLWSGRISGLPLKFKKGAAACFDIDRINGWQGELLWFAEPVILGRLARLF